MNTKELFENLKMIASEHSTPEKALNAICDVYNLKKFDENCCDPCIGAMQNSITGFINRHHPVGGLSLHVDSDMFRITQHPDAGDFEMEMPIGTFAR